MRIRRTRQAGSPAPLFVFFCPSSLFVFKFVVVRLTDVEYVSNGRNKHPPPKFFRTLRRQRPLGYGTLFLGRDRPTTFFKERRFWVFFLDSKTFWLQAKISVCSKKKTHVHLDFVFWTPGIPSTDLSPLTVERGARKNKNCKFKTYEVQKGPENEIRNIVRPH